MFSAWIYGPSASRAGHEYVRKKTRSATYSLVTLLVRGMFDILDFAVSSHAGLVLSFG